MNYEEMSDFEINRAVAIAEGHKCYYDKGTYTADNEHVTVKGNGTVGWFEPCKEPHQAWPIILDNDISLTKYRPMSEWFAYGGGICVNYDHDIESYVDCVYSHKNPLRAAMIVFLMMKDAECQKL